MESKKFYKLEIWFCDIIHYAVMPLLSVAVNILAMLSTQK